MKYKNRFLFYSIFVIILTNILLIPVYSAKAYKNISSVEVKQIISTPSSTALIIDVRTPEEFKKGNIQRSINIPLYNLKHAMLSKNIYKDTKIIVYCNSGNRSLKAAMLLDSLGFTNVYNLGGLNNWPYPLKK